LAEAAQQLGAKLIHVSTDYVFNGTAGRPYRETDPTEPLGVYGQSKRAGEEAIAATGAEAAIVRTAWVYGAGKTPNFVKTMLRLAADRPELRVVADQMGTPTWTGDLAATLAEVVTHLGPETAGIYHYTNSGAASWYDFAVAIFEEARAIDWPGLAIERVVPIATADYPTPARRPAYSVLWGGRMAELLGRTAPHWRSSLRQMLIEYKKQIHN
jgi:dTDP-4-dehydrorhamnose reductase